MVREITKSDVQELVAICEEGSLDATSTITTLVESLCRSWLRQNEALRWIPVSERLPNDTRDVQVLIGGEISTTGYVSRSVWHCRGIDNVEVTHWRSIGPLPKEGE